VVVTGCYDWFHTGHVRFCEEVSAYGDLYVVVGNDRDIRQLKGEGHPLIGEAERRYVVGSVRFVTQALISSGDGWLDADPEIRVLKPDIYAVNEDGDKGGKREYCAKLGIQYLVLKRTARARACRRGAAPTCAVSEPPPLFCVHQLRSVPRVQNRNAYNLSWAGGGSVLRRRDGPAGSLVKGHPAHG
jgi:cytidyltransferase-like protein